MLRVKNWEKFQHYKDRNPPWIKLHRELLHDYDFSCLQDASKLQLMLLWLLASQLDNKIPSDPEWLKNQLNIKGKLCLKELIDKGYLIDDSNMLAKCKQSAMPETETETETETYSTDREEVCAFEEFWKICQHKVKKPEALKSYKRALKIASHEEIMAGMIKYAESKKGEEKRFIAHPSTWLNQSRWLDEHGVKEENSFAKHKMPSPAGG